MVVKVHTLAQNDLLESYKARKIMTKIEKNIDVLIY